MGHFFLGGQILTARAAPALSALDVGSWAALLFELVHSES